MLRRLILSLFIFLLFLNFVKSQRPPFLQSEYERAITAYGPGLAVFSPYSYVDLFYDNLPFIGKIPVLGKEGTASKTGVSPFYPATGNPSRPFPPLYLARPLPIHAPDPVEVVAVPLDEEALHGEPLWPKELTLPWEEKEKEEGDDEDPEGKTTDNGDIKEVKNPFENIDENAPSKGTKDPFKPGFIHPTAAAAADSPEFESKEAVNWLNDKKVTKIIDKEEESKTKNEGDNGGEVDESVEYVDDEPPKSLANRVSNLREKLRKI